MGAQCINLCSFPKKPQLKQFKDILPDDIDNYHPQNVKQKLPKLSFQGSVSNIKIINCPNSYFSVRFKIDDVIQIDLPKKKIQPIVQLKRESILQVIHVQNQLKWLSKQQISFQMDEYELRTHFLNVYVFNQKKQISSHIRVNLFAIVNGPYRHDFFVMLEQSSARLLFDLNLSQKIEAKLQVLSVNIDLLKNYFGEEFNFSLKQLINGQVVSTSDMSTYKKIPYEMICQSATLKQLKEKQQSHKSPNSWRQKCKKPINSIQNTSNLSWNSENLQNSDQTQKNTQLRLSNEGKKKLPYLKILILSNQIKKSNIQFNLWNLIKNKYETIQINSLQKDAIIFGTTQTNLHKLFDSKCQTTKFKSNQNNSNEPNFIVQKRNLFYKQNLISHDGKVLGKCQFKLKLTNPKFFKQLSYCAKTEDGIINITGAFKCYSGKLACFKSNSVSDITRIAWKIQGLRKKLCMQEATVEAEGRQTMKLEDEILDQFQLMNVRLKNSLNQSFILSESIYQVGLLDTQNGLIQVLQQIYNFLAQKSSLYRQICWQIALNIYKRGEFYLQNLGFICCKQKQTNQTAEIKKKNYKLCSDLNTLYINSL